MVPHHNQYRPLTGAGESEARRLFYVALTRAKRVLMLSTNEKQWRPPSRFLTEIGLIAVGGLLFAYCNQANICEITMKVPWTGFDWQHENSLPSFKKKIYYPVLIRLCSLNRQMTC